MTDFFSFKLITFFILTLRACLSHLFCLNSARQLELSFSLSDGGHPADTDSSKSLALLEISCRKIAEQLTFKDAV